MRWFLAVVMMIAAPWPAAADEITDDVKRLAAAIGLRPGQTIADIGAGLGELTMELAREVGPSGRVFATELDQASRDQIRRSTDNAGLQQVTVIEAMPSRANLPPSCCDGIVMRFVYHHFADPLSMNRSLLTALKPGGHVVIIDFPPREGPTAPAEGRAANVSHGVHAETVIEELTAAGFQRISVTPGDDRAGYLVVMRKPN